MADSIFPLLSLTLLLLLLLLPLSNSSLPTVSISHLNPNQTLICALTKPPTQPQPRLNCTTTKVVPVPLSDINRFSFVGIVGGSQFLCGLTSPVLNSSLLVCWRFLEDGTTLHKRIYRGPLLKDIDFNDSHVCGIVSATNQLVCWQWDQFKDNSELNQTEFSSAGENYVRGLSELGQIRCAGGNSSIDNLNIINNIPTGNKMWYRRHGYGL